MNDEKKCIVKLKDKIQTASYVSLIFINLVDKEIQFLIAKLNTICRIGYAPWLIELIIKGNHAP